MRTTYTAGLYSIKYRGRGITHARLTQQEAKILFQLHRKNILEIECITFIK